MGELQAAPPCGSAALFATIDAADRELRTRDDCPEAAMATLRAALEELRSCAPATPPGRWAFPVEGIGPRESLGGEAGSGWVQNRRGRCFAVANAGHPAHDLFVDDTDHDSRDPGGRAFPLRAVADGLVVVAREGWRPGDPSKGGNLLMLWLPAEGLLAYYAHLEVVGVTAGQLVKRGDLLGTIGRTGVNAYARRSPTHLHFATMGDRDFVPRNPYRRLVEAEPQRAPSGP